MTYFFLNLLTVTSISTISTEKNIYINLVSFLFALRFSLNSFFFLKITKTRNVYLSYKSAYNKIM